MKQSLRSRVSAFVMALVMVFSLIPTTAFAADSVTATLVTNVSELTAGDQVVIVAKDYDYALSTNQRSNNRGAIAVTKDGSSIDLPSDIQLLTLEAGTKEGTFAFNTGSGYLYAASSSSNYLRTQTSKNDNSSWKISIAADGTASVVAQGSNTRATMQYNPNNGTPLFACYSSASQKAIAIYKLSTSSGGGSETPDPEVPTIVPISTALAGADGTEFTVKGVVTLLDGKNVYLQDATGGICVRMSADFTDLALGDTVIGTGAKSVYNGLTQLGSGTYEKSSGMTLTAKETTIGALTSADIGTYIALKGVEVTEVYDNNGAYSTPNITVTDGTNTIQLYKAVVGKTDGAWDVKVGDKLDVKAAVSVYNTTLQLRNTVADEITKVSAPIERQSGFITDLSTLQAGDQVVIFNTANGKILSQNPSYSGSYYNGGVDGTVTDGVLSGYTDTEIWVLTKTADGSYTIATADGKKLSMDTGFSSTPFDKVNDTWNIVPVSGKEGFYTIENVGRSGQKLQWRAGTYNYFSCYTGSGTAYEYQLYLVVNTSGEGGETPDPEVPEVTYADKMTALPNDGDIIIIYNSGNAMGSAASGKKLAAVAAEVTDNKLPIADGMLSCWSPSMRMASTSSPWTAST